MTKKIVLSPHTRGNITSVVTLQRKGPVDKKVALKSKIQDILNGRSRFVIWKKPAETAKGKESGSNDWPTSQVLRPTAAPRRSKEVVKDRCCLCAFFKLELCSFF